MPHEGEVKDKSEEEESDEATVRGDGDGSDDETVCGDEEDATRRRKENDTLRREQAKAAGIETGECDENGEMRDEDEKRQEERDLDGLDEGAEPYMLYEDDEATNKMVKAALIKLFLNVWDAMAPAMNEYEDNLNAEASYLKMKFGKDFDKPCEHTVYMRAGPSKRTDERHEAMMAVRRVRMKEKAEAVKRRNVMDMVQMGPWARRRLIGTDVCDDEAREAIEMAMMSGGDGNGGYGELEDAAWAASEKHADAIRAAVARPSEVTTEDVAEAAAAVEAAEAAVEAASDGCEAVRRPKGARWWRGTVNYNDDEESDAEMYDEPENGEMEMDDESPHEEEGGGGGGGTSGAMSGAADEDDDYYEAMQNPFEPYEGRSDGESDGDGEPSDEMGDVTSNEHDATRRDSPVSMDTHGNEPRAERSGGGGGKSGASSGAAGGEPRAETSGGGGGGETDGAASATSDGKKKARRGKSTSKAGNERNEMNTTEQKKGHTSKGEKENAGKPDKGPEIETTQGKKKGKRNSKKKA